MAGQIFHEWNGTVLTITSDSGTSSADLKGVGEMGPRGPQGPAGVSVGEGGNVDLSNYYTKDETYSKTEVDNKIAEAQLGGEGGEIDLSGYATKDDLAEYRKADNNTFDTAIRVRDDSNNMYIYAGGIQGDTEDLWIGSNGHAIFSYLLIKDKPVATQEWVNTAITNALAALDGSEVEY